MAVVFVGISQPVQGQYKETMMSCKIRILLEKEQGPEVRRDTP